MLIITCGGAPNGSAIGFRYWRNPGAMNEYLVNGALGRFLAFWKVFIQATFSYGGKLKTWSPGPSPVNMLTYQAPSLLSSLLEKQRTPVGTSQKPSDGCSGAFLFSTSCQSSSSVCAFPPKIPNSSTPSRPARQASPPPPS